MATATIRPIHAHRLGRRCTIIPFTGGNGTYVSLLWIPWADATAISAGVTGYVFAQLAIGSEGVFRCACLYLRIFVWKPSRTRRPFSLDRLEPGGFRLLR